LILKSITKHGNQGWTQSESDKCKLLLKIQKTKFFMERRFVPVNVWKRSFLGPWFVPPYPCRLERWNDLTLFAISQWSHREKVKTRHGVRWGGPSFLPCIIVYNCIILSWTIIKTLSRSQQVYLLVSSCCRGSQQVNLHAPVFWISRGRELYGQNLGPCWTLFTVP